MSLAAIELVLLSINAFGIRYSIGFESVVDYLGDWIAAALQLELVEAALRKLLALIEIDLPILGNHWQQMFVLLWLFQGSQVRALLSFGMTRVGGISLYAWAGVTALATSILIGTVPKDSGAIQFWLFAGFTLFVCGVSFHDHLSLPDKHPWWIMPASFGIVALCIFLGYLARATQVTKDSVLGIASQSPGILTAVFVVGAFGLMLLLFGATLPNWAETNEAETRRRRRAAGFASGSDIIGAYGIAIALALAGAYLVP